MQAEMGAGGNDFRDLVAKRILPKGSTWKWRMGGALCIPSVR
jgi:hypothetical protein